MVSMTGFACQEKVTDEFVISTEIRGYNSRFLEINVNNPPWLAGIEQEVRKSIASVCTRGKVDVSIRIKEKNTPIHMSVNIETAQAYYQTMCDLASTLKIKEKPGLSTLLGLDGVIDIEKNSDMDRYWKEIEPVLQKTIDAFVIERAREGETAEADILHLVIKIETSLQTVSMYAKEMENNFKETIIKKFSEILGNGIDENRILAETAAMLVKHTIAEEITRLGAHLEEFRAEIKRNMQCGKKLDFLSQEINREINTIGSKNTILEVSRAVVEMKEALENIREQLRNVE